MSLQFEKNALAQWGRTAKNRDVSIGPLARLFACSLTPLTHLLTPHRLLCFALLISLPTRSLPPSSWENMIRCIKTTWFCPTVRCLEISGDPFLEPLSRTRNHERNVCCHNFLFTTDRLTVHDSLRQLTTADNSRDIQLPPGRTYTFATKFAIQRNIGWTKKK